MALQTRRIAPESPARWFAAFERSVAAAVDLFEVAGQPGLFAVTSVSCAGTVHLTDGVTCTCHAALAGDAVCLHRAAVRAALDTLPEGPEPPAPAPVAAPAPCRLCHGTGWAKMQTGPRLSDWHSVICTCAAGGSGRRHVA